MIKVKQEIFVIPVNYFGTWMSWMLYTLLGQLNASICLASFIELYKVQCIECSVLRPDM